MSDCALVRIWLEFCETPHHGNFMSTIGSHDARETLITTSPKITTTLKQLRSVKPLCRFHGGTFLFSIEQNKTTVAEKSMYFRAWSSDPFASPQKTFCLLSLSLPLSPLSLTLSLSFAPQQKGLSFSLFPSLSLISLFLHQFLACSYPIQRHILSSSFTLSFSLSLPRPHTLSQPLPVCETLESSLFLLGMFKLSCCMHFHLPRLERHIVGERQNKVRTKSVWQAKKTYMLIIRNCLSQLIPSPLTFAAKF